MEIQCFPSILLAIAITGLSLAENSCTCRDKRLSVQKVVTHGNASVPCPKVTAEVMLFHLFRGRECEVKLHFNATTGRFDPPILAENQVDFRVDDGDKGTRFLLLNLTTERSALYTCEAYQHYPPPHKKMEEEPQTFVMVQEHQCEQSERCGLPPNNAFIWPWFGSLCFYGLVTSGLALFLWMKLKRMQASRPDYINMVPTGYRKNRGVQHPVRSGKY